MLEGLNKVDWETVRHFNGPATDVPKLLLDLLSEDRKTQSRAIHDLFGTIWYHGRVYEATAPIVPFLYEILENPSCFERFSIVWLLAAIAHRGSYPPAPHPENKSEVDKETLWAKNAHGAVRQGVKTILGLLDDKDKDLRLPVILLLVALPEEAEQIKPILLSVLVAEENDEARAGLGLALALLGDFHLEAFQCKNTKLPMVLIETLARACLQDEGMRVSAYQTIEACFLATMEKKDHDWLIDEKTLLNPTNLN
jgi:hypothetical protein